MRLSRVIQFAVVLAASTLLLAPPLAAQREWTAELFMGGAVNAKTPITIYQAGQPDIHIMAEWSTNPMTGSPYYAFRVAKWNGDAAWGVDFTHHKLYLDNTTAEVEHFELSHGYNLLHVSRIWRKNDWNWSGGVGVVVTHPENTVRTLELYPESGGTLGGGYYLDGISFLGALGRQQRIGETFFLSALGKVTLTQATSRVMDGGAEVPNAALHLNLGVGVRF